VSLTNPFGKAKKVPFPAGPAPKATGKPAPPPMKSMAKQVPAVAPGASKPGLSGVQYDGEGKDYSGMKAKHSTKNKVLNPIKSAIGLPGKPAKMVPKKPGQK
jgi:hypothetical protein